VGVQWQVQEAKQRLSELLRATRDEGPQVVTHHGKEVAVVVEIEEYRRLKGEVVDFKDYLRSGPDFEQLELGRGAEGPREVGFLADA
jgi:prevent-host-death family protein